MKDCMQIPFERWVHSFCKLFEFIYYMVSNNKWIHLFSCQFLTNYMTLFFIWFHIIYEIIIDFIHSSITDSSIIPHSSVQYEHYICPVCDRLSVHGVVVWCIYRSYANSSPAPWGGKYPSTDKEVKFGNKSESDMFQENHNNLIHFCLNQCEDIAWNCFGNKTSNQIGCLVRKLMECGHRVFDMLDSLLMVVLFLHIKIMWIATVERSIKMQCGFIILSSSNFFIPSTKRFKRLILSMITIHCLFVTSTMMSTENIQTSM